MKKIITFFTILFTIASLHAQNVQGEWEWAHFYSGRDRSMYWQTSNFIVSSHIDDHGNAYIYGWMGNEATFDGTNEYISDHSGTNGFIASGNGECDGVVIAKYDSIGNLLWRKVVKSSAYTRPFWMEVTDSLIYVLGEYVLGNDIVPIHWIYFFDTMIYEQDVEAIPIESQRFPFRQDDVTFYSILDLDGNLLESAFMGYQNDPNNYNNRNPHTLMSISSSSLIAPFKVDPEGNIYQLFELVYCQNSPVESNYFDIYIYTDDTTYHYNITLPLNTPFTFCTEPVYVQYIFKFSSDWELLWYQSIVDSVDGFIPTMHPYATGDDLNCPPIIRVWYHYYGMDIDEDNNIYLTGIVDPQERNGELPTYHNYPCHIYFDSNTYLTIENAREGIEMPFLVKFDSTGVPQWCRQIHRPPVIRSGPQYWVRAYFVGVDIEDDTVYVPFYFWIHRDDTIFVDENYSISNADLPEGKKGARLQSFLSFDKETGALLHHANHETLQYGDIPFHYTIRSNFVKNGNLFILSETGGFIDHYTTDGRWVESIPQVQLPYFQDYANVSVNNRGDLFFHRCLHNTLGSMPVPVEIGDFSLDCNPHRSNAVYAVYHNDAFAHPYVEYPQSISWEQDLTLFNTDTTLLLSANASSGYPITYRCSDTTLARISGDTLFTIPMMEGSATITACQEYAPYYFPSDTLTKTLTISRRPQTIEWNQLLVFDINNHKVALTATATGGDSITYQCSDTSIAHVVGDSLILHQTGTAQITAYQLGTPRYYEATPITKPLLIKGVNDIDTPSKLPATLYPNPANDKVTLQLPSTDPHLRKVEIYNPAGALVDTYFTTQFSVTHLPAGVYMVNITTNNNEYTIKMIKE